MASWRMAMTGLLARTEGSQTGSDLLAVARGAAAEARVPYHVAISIDIVEYYIYSNTALDSTPSTEDDDLGLHWVALGLGGGDA